jgi:hypothetical protein
MSQKPPIDYEKLIRSFSLESHKPRSVTTANLKQVIQGLLYVSSICNFSNKTLPKLIKGEKLSIIDGYRIMGLVSGLSRISAQASFVARDEIVNTLRLMDDEYARIKQLDDAENGFNQHS